MSKIENGNKGYREFNAFKSDIKALLKEFEYKIEEMEKLDKKALM